ncbi:DUF6155 family protein [Mucilaginibacter gotjawali]|uniref:Uncharacterized protein n=2 Tax=Mucilaginibacter gotjawali TaxID=1550579 RepID=A0A839SRG7_9SPHI|nr:DUF6155 family protein [Mucilaginibacter gotjawali]MBB3059069.1 hypothetical protein [Mucilaginibacter gotjawali]BAU52858.1 hypothetical protein MgSA37_01022 [Mucilaginibacter gotjawali]
MSIKTELGKLEKSALVEIICDLYKKNKAVQEYLNFHIKPDEDGLFEKYRAKVYEAFFPKRGFGYNLKQGKQSITDFKKLGPSAESLADLMLFYVETGVTFTNDFGDMNEAFYNSMVSTYANALKIIYKERLLDVFKERSMQIIDDTQDMGWGFHDSLSEIFYQFYE